MEALHLRTNMEVHGWEVQAHTCWVELYNAIWTASPSPTTATRQPWRTVHRGEDDPSMNLAERPDSCTIVEGSNPQFAASVPEQRLDVCSMDELGYSMASCSCKLALNTACNMDILLWPKKHIADRNRLATTFQRRRMSTELNQPVLPALETAVQARRRSE